MKRRKFLSSLGLLPALLQAASCNKRFPDAATIIKGRITDGQGNPVEGIRMVMMGTKPLSLSEIETFKVSADSDHNGEYLLSHVITKGSKTRRVDLFYEFYAGFPFAPGSFEIYMDEYDTRLTEAPDFFIHSNRYGKTNIFNLQFRKSDN